MLFSRRNDPIPDQYCYEIPERVRSWLLHTLKTCIEAHGRCSFRTVLDAVEKSLLLKVGVLREASQRQFSNLNEPPIIEHFFCCPDEEVLDFLQLCFETRGNCGGQSAVDAVNKVLEEETIGYELTNIQEVSAGEGSPYGGGGYYIVPPSVIKKDEKVLHAQTVRPCLHALSDSRFATANRELLNAFDEYRQGKYGDAVTDAGAAFESVLKIICTHKNWPYDKDKDTCSKLLDICRENKLFYPFYKQILEGTATIRNKIGDAHGKGPTPEYPPTKELADHMLYNVCNNINLVIGLAKL